MKNKYYKIFSTVLLILSVIMLVVFIVSSYFIFINQPSLTWQPDSVGFSYFLKIFSPSIQIGTSSIVFFTLWLTFERMRQTQNQLDITLKNIAFNNYYKHKEEFSSFLNKMPFFAFLKKHSQIEVETLFPAIYSYFFNKSYKNFEARLNSKSRDEINNFIAEIKKSPISIVNQDLEQISIEEIKKLSELINRTIEPICSINTEIEVVTVRQHFMEVGGKPLKLVEERFKLLNNLFWAISLYEDFLAFDGIYQSERANFALNFAKYRATIGL
ncbi:MAG: hypothetical protein KF816_02875 [Melioribacteraceae bacterium]|nr:hypothetical protein [Melioribacteraceae bacterium]